MAKKKQLSQLENVENAIAKSLKDGDSNDTIIFDKDRKVITVNYVPQHLKPMISTQSNNYVFENNDISYFDELYNKYKPYMNENDTIIPTEYRKNQ